MSRGLGFRSPRIGSCSEISWARSQMASVAMLEGNESFMFIDSDMVFNQHEVQRFFERPEPILGGSYPQKRFGKLNADLPTEIDKVSFGTAAPPGGYQARHVGAGFLRIKSWVLQHMIQKLELPCCTFHGGQAWPFFLPFVMMEYNDKWAYLGEDYAFCERATQAGIPIILDTSVRLFHLGIYPYGWEEAANLKVERYNGFTIKHDSVERTFAKQAESEARKAAAQTNGQAHDPIDQPVVAEDVTDEQT